VKKRWVAIVVVFAGCATVLKRPAERIAVDSKPAGGEAVIECAGGVRERAVTPARITIPRSAEKCALSISKPGYTTKILPLERGLNGAYWSNFALLPGITLALFLSPPTNNEDRAAQIVTGAVGLGGILGFFVDRSNGRGFRHFPDEISETLEPAH
jgi:hypothetical protein